MLKEKEDVIKKLQSDNANLSSRSFISFANNGNSSKDWSKRDIFYVL